MYHSENICQKGNFFGTLDIYYVILLLMVQAYFNVVRLLPVLAKSLIPYFLIFMQ